MQALETRGDVLADEKLECINSALDELLIDLVYSLKSGHRQNAHWMMNRSTQAEIRKLKNADGNYLWQPPAGVGANASLMNFPITEAEDMPISQPMPRPSPLAISRAAIW